MADSADRAALCAAQKVGLGPREKLRQRAPGEPFARIEVGQLALLRELVPRADQLAVVAAVDAVAHQRAQLQRNGTAVLDGEVGNAAPRIEPLRRDDGLRRAHVDACAAAAAMRRHGFARRQRHVDVDLAQEEHRARVAVEHERVLAAPALPAARGQLGFEHRGGVGEGAVPEGPDLFGDALGQLREPVAQHLVIVPAPRIDRHDGFAGPREAVELRGLPLGAGVARQVVHARGDHAHRARHQVGRAGAAGAVCFHVLHLAMEPMGQPLHQTVLGAR